MVADKVGRGVISPRGCCCEFARKAYNKAVLNKAVCVRVRVRVCVCVCVCLLLGRL